MHCSKNLIGIEASANAYYAAHHESTKRRDAAIIKLRNTPLMVQEVSVPVICMAFGRIDRSVIWNVTCGLIFSPNVIHDAIVNKFKGVDYNSDFEIRPSFGYTLPTHSPMHLHEYPKPSSPSLEHKSNRIIPLSQGADQQDFPSGAIYATPKPSNGKQTKTKNTIPKPL
ncbi:hypothetical protein MMC22_004991 [Lobaria immixta]|nr:hypothetical protein [Lobaria immixta]